MMKLYTAVGRYKLEEQGLPVIVTGDGTERGLDAHELIIWSSLAFRILTYDELKREFYEKERELRILGDLDFDHYLNRLTMRNLIASGRDCTGVDALYDLLGRLYAQSIPNHFLVRTLSFLKLFFCKRMALKDAALLFRKEELTASEKQVLSLLKHQMLSTAELIQCVEKGQSALQSTDELMELLYQDSHCDCETIITDSRFSETRILTLTAIANLYLKQQIILQIL